MSIFEALMLICFGAAWPFSIYRSWKSGTSEGKSLFFLLILLGGYLSGIIHKVKYSYDHVIFLYILNFTMVGIDTLLFFRNKKRVKEV